MSQDIGVRSPGRDGVSQRLTTVSKDSSRRLMCILLFEPTQTLQHVHGCDFANRYPTDPRENILLVRRSTELAAGLPRNVDERQSRPDPALPVSIDPTILQRATEIH